MAVALKVALCVLACMVVAAPHTEAVLSCNQVMSSLYPCLGYMQGSEPLPPACCSGVNSLNRAARTTPDRQAACTCLKQLANNFGNGSDYVKKASGIPGKCGVNIGYPISLSVDCSKVK